MEVIRQTLQNNSVENILEIITGIREVNHYDNYVAIIFRNNYLGKNINVNIYLSNDEEELEKVLTVYNTDFLDYFPCSAIFKNNLFIDGNNEYILFKRDCKGCIHNCMNSNTKERVCSIFNCPPDLVTYICFNKEAKQ